MTKKEMLQQKTLKLLTMIPICSTPQIANLFFSDAGSPISRACDLLSALKVEKLIEGESRKINEPKVWRLTKKGREVAGTKRPAVWLNSGKVNHYLAIGDVFVSLYKNGKLTKFETELREHFLLPDGKELIYSPDAYFVYNGCAYLLEVQLTPLTSDRWNQRWKKANLFFEYGLEKANWQIITNTIIKPEILVISSQTEDNILTGSYGITVKIIRDRFSVAKELEADICVSEC